MTRVDSWSGLFDDTKMYEGSHDLRTFLTGISFLVVLVARPSFFNTSAEPCADSASFGTPSCVERRFRSLCFLFILSTMLKISPSGLGCNGSWFGDLCLGVSLGVLRSRLLFFVGDDSLPVDCVFFELCSSIIDVDDLGEELGRDCVATQATVRCMVEFKQVLRRIQINYKH